jgi:hypothetical protein
MAGIKHLQTKARSHATTDHFRLPSSISCLNSRRRFLELTNNSRQFLVLKVTTATVKINYASKFSFCDNSYVFWTTTLCLNNCPTLFWCSGCVLWQQILHQWFLRKAEAILCGQVLGLSLSELLVCIWSSGGQVSCSYNLASNSWAIFCNATPIEK